MPGKTGKTGSLKKVTVNPKSSLGVGSLELGVRDIPHLPPKERLLDLLYYMKLTRELEYRIEKILYRQGKVVGGVYVGRGQEAVTVGAAIHLVKEDWICPSHRDMAAFLIRGMALRNILAQYMGRSTGATRGRDGNMHMGSLSHHLIGFVSMLGDNVPVAAGIGLALMKQKKKNISLCFFGDGATSRGDWHEGLNLASVLKTPTVYICNNNAYAYSTPNSKQYVVKDVASRAEGYGIPWEVVDGNDILAVHAAAGRAVERARAGKGPSMIECKTFRMTGHSAHDDAGYVPKKSFDEWIKKDPIARFEQLLTANKVVNNKYIETLVARIKRDIDAALDVADKDPYPTPEDCLKDVYADKALEQRIPWWRLEGNQLSELNPQKEWGEYSTTSQH